MSLHPTLWYENQLGEKWFIPPDVDPLNPKPPDGFHYQVSRFPRELRTTHLKINEDGSSELLMTGAQTWPDDLVAAMVRGQGPCDSSQPRQPMMPSKAILQAATACERCLNVLGHDYGLPWGYPLDSPQWQACNTECSQCVKGVPE